MLESLLTCIDKMKEQLNQLEQTYFDIKEDFHSRVIWDIGQPIDKECMDIRFEDSHIQISIQDNSEWYEFSLSEIAGLFDRKGKIRYSVLLAYLDLE